MMMNHSWLSRWFVHLPDQIRRAIRSLPFPACRQEETRRRRERPVTIAPIIGWRAWYADGGRPTSTETRLVDLPDDGLLILLAYFEEKAPSGSPRKEEYSGCDTYFAWMNERNLLVFGCNDDSVEEVRRRYVGAVVIRGQGTDNRFYEKVAEEARLAVDAP